MGTISRADWQARSDWALVCRRIHARNDHNWAKRQMAWQRRREVFHLWYRWRARFRRHRGLQQLIA